MNQKRRKLSWIVIPGLIFLAILSLGAGWLIALPAAGSRSQPAPPSPPSSPGPGVVCFGSVDLEQGCTALYPLQPGRVARVLVRANDKVKAGTPLLTLED